MKKVKLMYPYAGYRAGVYKLGSDKYYRYEWSNFWYALHKDIVERLDYIFIPIIDEPTLWEVCWDIFVEKWRTKKAFIDLINSQEWGKKFEDSKNPLANISQLKSSSSDYNIYPWII